MGEVLYGTKAVIEINGQVVGLIKPKRTITDARFKRSIIRFAKRKSAFRWGKFRRKERNRVRKYYRGLGI